MKHPIKKALIVGLFFSVSAKAQIAPEIIKKYPAHILVQIQHVTSRVSLPLDQQEKLAQYYTLEDGLAEAKKAQGGSLEEIDKFYSLDIRQLSKLLTPLQLNDYNTAELSNNTSELAKALKYRKELQLSKTQVNELLTRVSNDKTVSPPDLTLSKSIEFNSLKEVLSKDQFQFYFKVINKDKALTVAQDNWIQLKKFNLVQNSDSAKITDELFKHLFDQYTGIDQINYSRPKATDSVARFYTLFRPYILWKLDAYRNTLPWWVWGQTGRIIELRKELNLTNIQVDSLLYNNINLEKQKWNSPSRYSNEFINNWPAQIASILRVLNAEQYNRFLEIKNYNHSLFNADNDWLALKKAGLILPETDTIKVMAENQKYELRWLVANERVNNNRSQQNLFAKQAIENNKPQLLKKLDAVNNETAVNKNLKESFAW